MTEEAGEWVARQDGTLELVDPTTGEVLAREKRNPAALERTKNGGKLGPAGDYPPQSKTHHWILDKHGRRCWVPKGTNPDQLPGLIYPYAETTADHICRFLVEGNTLDAIGKMPEMPPIHILYKWMARYPEFKTRVKEARKLRAENFHDKALETAKNSKESRVQSDRLKVETLKWAAERGDPDSYGKQTKIVGDPERPIAILVDTGIVRTPPDSTARSEFRAQGAAPSTCSASSNQATAPELSQPALPAPPAVQPEVQNSGPTQKDPE